MTKPSVLIVDDVEANLIALEAQLSQLDCNLVLVNSGNDGLRELLKHEFAVMLLDVQMPEMDGYEMAGYARENPATRDVPIIFVTAMLETEATALRGYGSGAVDFLFKPVNPYILRSKVQVFLDLYTGRRKVADTVAAHERTLKDLEAFNYSVSHDLRAPLRPLDGFSQTLLEDYGDKLDETGRGYLLKIRAAAQRMAQLIDDLLRLSRIRSTELRAQELDLSLLVEAIATELRAGDPGRKVEFVIQPALMAQGDPGLLRIALENLLRNAWKFTAKNPQAHIHFGRNEGPERAYFVRDDGVGFDMTYATRMGQPFQRFHSGAQFEGTGIGLAIVALIVRNHRGRFWADSAPARGATFFFTLELPEAPAAATPAG
jgi:two-component system, sensor histidine kinase and response regulator